MGERDSIHLQFSFSVGEDREKVSPYQITPFLFACYATLHPALLVRPSVRPSVGPSVTPVRKPRFTADLGHNEILY